MRKVFFAFLTGFFWSLDCLAQSPETATTAITPSIPSCQLNTPQIEWTDCVGTRIYPLGWVYIGEYRNGKRNGFGRQKSPRGVQHVGNWINDQADGLGITYDSNGSIIHSGTFSRGKLVQSQALDPLEFSFEPKAVTTDNRQSCIASETPEDSPDFTLCTEIVASTKRMLELDEREYQLQLEIYRSQKAAYDELQAERERQQRQRTAAALATLGAAIGGATSRSDIARGLSAATRAAQTGNVELPVEPSRSNFPQERTVILPNGRLVNCSIIEMVVTCR